MNGLSERISERDWLHREHLKDVYWSMPSAERAAKYPNEAAFVAKGMRAYKRDALLPIIIILGLTLAIAAFLPDRAPAPKAPVADCLTTK